MFRAYIRKESVKGYSKSIVRKVKGLRFIRQTFNTIDLQWKIPQTCCCCSGPQTCQSSHLSYWGRCRGPPRPAPLGCSGWRQQSPWRPWPASWWWTPGRSRTSGCSWWLHFGWPVLWSGSEAAPTKLKNETEPTLDWFFNHVQNEELLATWCCGVDFVTAHSPYHSFHTLYKTNQ